MHSLFMHGSPDGVGPDGVFFDHYSLGGWCKTWSSTYVSGQLSCEKHRCVDPKTGHNLDASLNSTFYYQGTLRRISSVLKDQFHCRHPAAMHGRGTGHDGITPFKGVCDKTEKKAYCDQSGAPQVCQKMKVLHVEEMSRSAGVLIMKRTSCDIRGKCSVFKSGLCIDLRRNIWRSSKNVPGIYDSIADGEPRRGMLVQSQQFGRAAAKLLRHAGKHWKGVLPKRFRCSDHRNQYRVRSKRDLRKWFCYKKCSNKNKDATLAKFAILNF